MIKRAIVTGGAGFIGSHLTRKLITENIAVTVIDDLSEGKWENLPNHKNLKKYKASILDKNIGRLFKNTDVVFHLAALPRVQRSFAQPRETHDVNVTGTLNVLMAARDNKVSRFIFSSSSSVYGNQKNLPLREKMTPDPMSPYAVQKLMAEEYCKLFSEVWGLNTLVLRYFNVYGPGMRADGAYATLFPKFIGILKSGKAPVINGSGSQKRDFTYVDDVVEATIMAGKSKISGEVINIGYGKSITVNAATKTLLNLMDKKIKPIYGPPVTEPRSTLSDSSKAKKILGWEPKTNLENGLKTMLKQSF